MADVADLIKRNYLEAPQVALARVTSFLRRHGRPHFALACHAALPLTLTPDLLEQLWANFTPQTPWVAIADVLLSRLCREVGHETYEIWPHTRELLLEELRDDAGEAHMRDVALFVNDYVKERLMGDPTDTEANYQSRIETINALFYTNPSGNQAKQAIIAMAQDPAIKPLRMLGLVETWTVPIGDAKAEVLASLPTVEEVGSQDAKTKEIRITPEPASARVSASDPVVSTDMGITPPADITVSGKGGTQAANITQHGTGSITVESPLPPANLLAEAARLTHLRNLLVQSFSLEELKQLGFDLKTEYEDLEGGTKSAKATSLVRLMSRRDALRQLIDTCAKERRALAGQWQFPGLRPMLRRFAAALASQFDENELRELSIAIGITMPVEAIGDKNFVAQQLVQTCTQNDSANLDHKQQHTDMLDRVIDLCQERRPNTDWSTHKHPQFMLAWTQMQDRLTRYFSADELTALELELGVESNSKNVISERVISLINHCATGLHDELGAACELARPMVNWTTEEPAQTAQVKSLPELRRAIEEAFSLEDLKLLSDDMNLDFEELSGNTRIAKTQSLLTYLQRRERLPELIAELKRRRRARNWDEFLEQPSAVAEADVLSNLIASNFSRTEVQMLAQKLEISLDELGPKEAEQHVYR